MYDAVYDDGVMRDVYPYNLLSARHLARDIDGRSLRAWIEAAPSRGRLQAWPDGYALWTVARDRVDEIRQQLTGAGVLFVRCPTFQR